jgi:hypothetical protein
MARYARLLAVGVMVAASASPTAPVPGAPLAQRPMATAAKAAGNLFASELGKDARGLPPHFGKAWDLLKHLLPGEPPHSSGLSR